MHLLFILSRVLGCFVRAFPFKQLIIKHIFWHEVLALCDHKQFKHCAPSWSPLSTLKEAAVKYEKINCLLRSSFETIFMT